jgi:hypothetical protein
VRFELSAPRVRPAPIPVRELRASREAALRDLNWLGLAVVLAIVFAAMMVVGRMRLSRPTKVLVSAALLLRVAGAVAYLGVFGAFYGGGDYELYYQRALVYSQRMAAGDFSMFYVSVGWVHGDWWGTQFVVFATAIVLSVVGENMLAAFIVFALFSFLGLIGFGLAFRRTFPDRPVVYYLRWILLFPSLWFWPSAIGKEAVILLGLGLCVAGYVGKAGKTSWLPAAAGLFVVFGIRPQVAAVVLTSVLVSEWLALGGRWTMGKTIQGVLVVALAMAGLWLTTRYLGMSGAEAQDVGGYMNARAATADAGGSAVEAAQVGWGGIPLAMTNILFRPFPWEARNTTAMLSSGEILAFWAIVAFRLRAISHSFWSWRADRLRRVALSFIILYSATLGMVVVNLGIIARQRIVLFPFLFVFLEATPAVRRAAKVYAGRLQDETAGRKPSLLFPESR